HRLAIPNREVRLVYAQSFRQWMQDRMRGHGGSLDALTSALLSGDAVAVQRELGAFARDLLSYHDAGGVRPENMYQGFVIGLLAVMEETHHVRSNRESGKGRPDVMIRPRAPGQPGAVLELKVARAGEKTLDAALAEGLAQLADKDYAAELRTAGAEPVHGFAVAFDGKVVRVRSAVAVDEGDG
ncbi:PD-(D/E)XK nuclease domain-containing protein, partial [Haliangium sp.]|uniref:PD-(D/E)XK nuclease domain-containing protein n=1 Tax=Haliangium sp. TaxID=2663208 RepID=UPI003D1231A2